MVAVCCVRRRLLAQYLSCMQEPANEVRASLLLATHAGCSCFDPVVPIERFRSRAFLTVKQ